MLAQPVQAFHVAVQAPDIVRVLRGAAQGIVQAQIGPVDRFRLFQVALLQ